MPVAAGKLSKRVFIEQPVVTTTDSGESRNTWENAEQRQTPRAARIDPLSGRELEIARQVHAEVTHRIEIRRLRLAAPKMRVNWRTKDRRFNILAVIHVDEADEETHLFCNEVVGRGDIEE